MKKALSLFFAATFLLSGTVTAGAFTTENHAVVAYIAEQHMTPEAVANFRKAFDNHPLVEFSSYPDFFRSIYIAKDKKLGHMLALDENMYPIKSKGTHSLKAYDCMLRAIDQLKHYKDLDDSTKYTAMGMLTHFMGDSHCPSHISYADKRHKIGYIYYKMYLDDEKAKPKKVKYHSFWDDWCTDQRYPHGFIERAMYFDICSEEEIKEIQKGSLRDWMHACAVDCQDIYDVQSEQLVDRVYVIRKAEVAASQIRKAGYRLAAVMNELFAK